MNDELREQLRAAAAKREPALLSPATVAALDLTADDVVVDPDFGLAYFELECGWAISRLSAEGLQALGFPVH